MSIPLTDSQAYDLIVDNGDGLKRVQVKTTTYLRKSSYEVGLRIHGGNRSGKGKTKLLDRSSVELLFIVTSDDTMYLIPTSIGRCTTMLRLGPSYDSYRVT